jgi:hypothetical protein
VHNGWFDSIESRIGIETWEPDTYDSLQYMYLMADSPKILVEAEFSCQNTNLHYCHNPYQEAYVASRLPLSCSPSLRLSALIIIHILS